MGVHCSPFFYAFTKQLKFQSIKRAGNCKTNFFCSLFFFLFWIVLGVFFFFFFFYYKLIGVCLFVGVYVCVYVYVCVRVCPLHPFLCMYVLVLRSVSRSQGKSNCHFKIFYIVFILLLYYCK